MSPLIMAAIAAMILISVVANEECLPTNQHIYDSPLCRSEGERCSSNTDCLSGVCYLSNCVRDSSGKRCSSDIDCRQFFSYSECRDNYCVRLGATGDKCRNELDCSSELCFGGRCLPIDDGDGCSRDVQCRSTSICSNGLCTPLGRNCSVDGRCSLLEECFVGNHTCIRRHTTAAGTGCSSDADCQTGLICGRVDRRCVIPDTTRLGASCLLSSDCANIDSQECACTHYPGNAYRCVTAGAPQSICLAQLRDYIDCMRSAECSVAEAALSLRGGQCALERCASESYLLLQCRAYDNPCRPFTLDALRQWTGVKDSSTSSSSSSTTDYYPINRGDSSPPWTWVFVLIFCLLIVSIAAWTLYSAGLRPKPNLGSFGLSFFRFSGRT